MKYPARRIHAQGINGEQLGDFLEMEPDGWLGVDFQRSAGICIYSWENIITRLADLIGDGHIWRLDGNLAPVGPAPVPFTQIDRAGNIWLDHEYLAPHQYLPVLIPKEV